MEKDGESLQETMLEATVGEARELGTRAVRHTLDFDALRGSVEWSTHRAYETYPEDRMMNSIHARQPYSVLKTDMKYLSPHQSLNSQILGWHFKRIIYI